MSKTSTDTASPLKAGKPSATSSPEPVVKAAASKELEKLGIKGGDVKGAVDEKKREAEAAAQQRIEEEKQKAAEKLNQKIGEGLNKLFNR